MASRRAPNSGRALTAGEHDMGAVFGWVRRFGPIAVMLGALAGAPALAADEMLAEAQNILLMLGFHPGATKGDMTPQTAKALSEFQRANKLGASGKLDEP